MTERFDCVGPEPVHNFDALNASRVGEVFKGNAGYDWHRFNTVDYAGINYKELNKGDTWLYRFSINCYRAAGIPLRSLSRVIDLGNGGMAASPGLIAPLVRDGGVIEWTDVGQQQLATAAQTIELGRQGDIGLWTPHQGSMKDIDPEWSGCIERGCSLGEVVTMSAFDVPEEEYEAAHAPFVLESCTDDPAEHEQGLITTCKGVKPGGSVLIWGMDNSDRYDSAGTCFPAVRTNAEHTLGIVWPYLTDTKTTFVAVNHGVRPEGSLTKFRGFFAVFGIRNEVMLAA